MILPIGIYKQNSITKSDANEVNPRARTNFATFGKPLLHTDVVQISFGRSAQKLSTIFKMLDELPCAYSGRPMLSQEKFNKISGSALLEKPSAVSLEYFRKYKKYMFKHERQIFNLLEKYSLKMPGKNISEIFRALRPKSIEKLEEREIFILQKVKHLAKTAVPEQAKQVGELVHKATEQILRQKEGDYFKRKEFIAQLHSLKHLASEPKQFDELLNVARNLPTSGNDISAFIVKYSQKNPHTNDWSGRSSKDIVKRLISSSLASTEHVKARSLGGKSELDNYLRTCAGTNLQKSDLRLKDYITSYPDIHENLQKYIDGVIEFVNQNKFGRHSNYPIKIAQAIYKESAGSIKLDLSKLRKDKHFKDKDLKILKCFQKKIS